MSNQLELQMEALSELMDYSEKIIKGTEEVIKELRGTERMTQMSFLVWLFRVLTGR